MVTKVTRMTACVSLSRCIKKLGPTRNNNKATIFSVHRLHSCPNSNNSISRSKWKVNQILL